VARIGQFNEEMLFRECESPTPQDHAWRPNLRLLYEAAPDPTEIFDLVVESVIDGIHGRMTQRSSPSDSLSRDESAPRPLTGEQARNNPSAASRQTGATGLRPRRRKTPDDQRASK
jgi:hypothetical protein